MLAAARADVIIAEFDAINIGSAADVDGNASDWIELRNSGSAGVSLNGWALSDDPGIPGKWVFPNVSIGGLAQLRVFASAKNRSIASVELHTNFKLSGDGEYLGVYGREADGSPYLDYVEFPLQTADVSWSLVGEAWGADNTPTPGAANE